MAAINICHELLQQSEEAEESESSSIEKIQSLQQKIEKAIQDSRQIEI